jgi:hypothetical protein
MAKTDDMTSDLPAARLDLHYSTATSTDMPPILIQAYEGSLEVLEEADEGVTSRSQEVIEATSSIKVSSPISFDESSVLKESAAGSPARHRNTRRIGTLHNTFDATSTFVTYEIEAPLITKDGLYFHKSLSKQPVPTQSICSGCQLI